MKLRKGTPDHLMVASAMCLLRPPGQWKFPEQYVSGLSVDAQISLCQYLIAHNALSVVSSAADANGIALPVHFQVVSQRNRLADGVLQTVHRNELKALAGIMQAVSARSMIFRGIDLAENVWPQGARSADTLDVLIQSPQIEDAKGWLATAGYVQGTLDREACAIVPLTAEKIGEEEADEPKLSVFRKIIRVPELDEIAAHFAAENSRSIFFVANNQAFAVSEIIAHYNVLDGVAVPDVWARHRLVDLAGESYRAQDPADMLWTLATLCYHETMLSVERPILAFLDVMALLAKFAAQMDWERVKQIAHTYALEPGLYYVLRHADHLLGGGAVPRKVLRKLHPGGKDVVRRRDWGDFTPRLFEGDLVYEPLLIEPFPAEESGHNSSAASELSQAAQFPGGHSPSSSREDSRLATSVQVLPEATGTIVIGGGTAGAVFAGLLAERSTEPVLLLESGPDYGSFKDGAWPADLVDAKRVTFTHDWNYSSGATYAHRVLPFPRARVLGGCSAHNGCTAAIGAREDYDDWASAGNPGWSAAEVEPLFDLIRDRFRVRTYSLEELTPTQAGFVAAGREQGLPLALDLDRFEAGVGIGPMAANVVQGVRWNAAFAFLDPVRDKPHLQIAGNVTTDRVIVESGRATGVRVVSNGQTHVVRAQRVILCAGVFGSPSILLRSGIGAAASSLRLGLKVTADLPGVGRNLLDHPCVRLDFAPSDDFTATMGSQPWNPDEQVVGRAKSPLCDRGPYDIHVFLSARANNGPGSVLPISLYGGAMRARSQGVLRLIDTNPELPPMIDPRYVSDPEGHDHAVLRGATKLLREMILVHEFRRFLGKEISVRGDIADTVVSYCHPAGTCKMGPANDPSTVVDAACRVHGLEGLYVADASIMPTIPRGNINLPTAMIAARVVAKINI